MDVEFFTRRPAAFCMTIEGDWDAARQMLDCLTSAGLTDNASLNVASVGENGQLSLTVQVQASKTDASIGTMFEKTGQVIRSLEKAGIIKGIQLW